jgi:hypothetical protein
MTKLVVLILAISIFGACQQSATPAPSEPFIILDSLTDQGANSVVISIRINSPANQEAVKQAAETVIDQHKSQYQTITVRSYLPGAEPSGAPYALSIYKGREVTHRFDPRAATQKIPTH